MRGRLGRSASRIAGLHTGQSGAIGRILARALDEPGARFGGAAGVQCCPAQRHRSIGITARLHRTSEYRSQARRLRPVPLIECMAQAEQGDLVAQIRSARRRRHLQRRRDCPAQPRSSRNGIVQPSCLHQADQ